MRAAEGERTTYTVGNGPAHRGNHDDASPVPELHHLLRRRLRGHETPGYVHAHHRIAVSRRVFQGRSLLLYAGRGDQPIQTPVLRRYGFHDGIQLLDIPDVDASVVEGSAQFLFGTLLDAGEVVRGAFKAVEGVYCCERLVSVGLHVNDTPAQPTRVQIVQLGMVFWSGGP